MTRTRSRPDRKLSLTIAAASAAFSLAPALAHAQENQNRLIVSVELTSTKRQSFQGQLLYNCNLFFAGNRPVDGSPQVAQVAGAPSGSIDFTQNRGEAFVKKGGWQVEPLPPVRAKPTLFADLGVS